MAVRPVLKASLQLDQPFLELVIPGARDRGSSGCAPACRRLEDRPRQSSLGRRAGSARAGSLAPSSATSPAPGSRGRGPRRSLIGHRVLHLQGVVFRRFRVFIGPKSPNHGQLRAVNSGPFRRKRADRAGPCAQGRGAPRHGLVRRDRLAAVVARAEGAVANDVLAQAEIGASRDVDSAAGWRCGTQSRRDLPYGRALPHDGRAAASKPCAVGEAARIARARRPARPAAAQCNRNEPAS